MRCFVAVELDPALRRPLVGLLRRQVPRTRDVRWCTEQQLHVTLKFLGEVSDRQLSAVCDAVAAAAEFVQPFSVCLSGLGCFPTVRNPRVLWCGVEDESDGCARWVELADPLFEDLGFPRETRRFHPHITLGRSKSPAGGDVMRRVLEEVSAPATPAMTVEQIVLFESQLAPGGAQYTPRCTARLGK
ncbi:MAG: RNA 2',3'-cyclic phosphodiesterase [Planctomycetes bacterium]|nr:RNA 2',3'-cyclic phosphodiesterase [Planctomycetota bacterium]